MANRPPGPFRPRRFKTGNPRQRPNVENQNTNVAWDNRQQGQNTKNSQPAKNKERRKYNHDIIYRFKKLEELSNKDPMAVIVEITGQESGFAQMLNSELTDDCLVLVMKIMALVCSPGTVNGTAIIRTQASKDSFHKSLQRFVLNLTVQDEAERRRSSHFWNDPNSFFSNAAVVFQLLVDSIPSRAYEVLPKTLKSFKVMITNNGIDTEALERFKKLENTLELFKVERTKKSEVSNEKYEVCDDSNVEPPDDFRAVEIYPTAADVLQDRGYLRKNLIDKGYESVDHYLDVQFRLLKEDFVGPLRDGIAEYMGYDGSPKEVIKASDVKIYTKVRFISPTSIRNRLGVLLQFQTVNKKHPIKINSHKRFMFGSLLCFTNDNFQSLLFGKVIERSMDLLEKGQVVVGFESGQDTYVLDQPYVMIECSVYFEPYYHVLKALQNMDETQFPMQKYIIDLNPAIDEVSYIQPELRYTLDNNDRLNPTQRNAFLTALEKEFVVIQGPPGTGKTFLGLKIAKTLIKNKQHWYKSGPILVVCYTNHALDQFLEGLQDTTTEMVRVGGQSRNENMEKFSLKEKRRSFKRSRMNYKALNAVEDKHYKCLSNIKRFNDILKDIDSNTVIIDIKKLSIVDESISSSWFWTATDQEIIDWLFGGRTHQDRLLEKKKIKIKKLQETIDQDNLDDQFGEILYAEIRDEREIDDGFDIKIENSTNHRLTTVDEIKALIEKIKCEEAIEVTEHNKNLKLKEKRFQLEDQLNYLQMRFEQYENDQVQNKPQNTNFQNPHSMSADIRWWLYFYWVTKYKEHVRNILVQLQAEYITVQEQYSEMKDIFDLEIMKEMLVVGMTTTGAARLQTMIKLLKNPIVIVEEAAEVLESHVIVSLTSHCQHLILIGDHQQLRPSTSNYYIERHYNLGISLFERMVRNNLQCHVLGVQHRMRPEIASLIVPAIYPKLENHSSVFNYPPVAGIVPNLYFIDHRFKEEQSIDSSKLNQHEAKYLVALARYLIQNGYKPEDITILAAYSAQMFAVWQEQKKRINLLQGIKITVLDNYQGEENKIILLSLVRNNEKNSIGFLKIENRVCVALSRAKEGFYIMGNMDLLCQNSSVWPKIRTVLESQGNLGQSLLLQCQRHLDQKTAIALPEDFIKVAEGGCSKVCNTQLTCGHNCTMICHVLDRGHEKFKCKAKCIKILCENGHPCTDFCFKECKPCSFPMNRTLPCGHKHTLPCHVNIDTFQCTSPVEAELPCGHTDPSKPCHRPIDTHTCPFPCDTRVEPCGHACLKMCHFRDDPDHLEYNCPKPCEKPRADCSTGTHKCWNKCYETCVPCEIVVEKKRSCTHKVKVPCNVDPNLVQCNNNCKRLLPCDHACKKKCHEPCGDCNVMVTKELEECKHSIRIKCSTTPSRKLCHGKCPLLLPCGHNCRKRCNQTCTVSCKALVNHSNHTACGHSFKIECHMRHTSPLSDSFELLKFCNSPCRAILSCTHVCSGTCGECVQGRIHKPCTEKCGATLVCGHPCPISCRDACQPCAQKCSYKCLHSACKKMCGEPCTRCKEKCSRKCPHIECTALCGDVCTVPPCKEPCPKKLSCWHDCVGFCGDPCPPLCRQCNNDELTEIFFGEEDEPDARFVLLDECNHVIESNGMEMWLQGNEEDQAKIAPKCCPRCKTILTSTQRYSDYIKKALLNLCDVKEKYAGNNSDNRERREELLNKVAALKRERQLMKDSIFNTTLETFENAIVPTRDGRWQPLNLMLYTIYLSKLQIIENIVGAFKKGDLNPTRLTEIINLLFSMLLRNENKLSKQETTDFQRELKRFYLLVQLMQIQDASNFGQLRANAVFLNTFKQTRNILFSIKIFTDDCEKEAAKNLDYITKTFPIAVSKFEFQQVINAMGMAKGHWFKCPNGHIYAIGECGGAMQTSKCADCGADIGGRNHQLESRNSHAGDVDESRFAAYSEEANNLFNYQEFRNF